MSIKVEIGMPTSHVSDTLSTYHRHTYALSDIRLEFQFLCYKQLKWNRLLTMNAL